jgi:DNA adenine methylase
MGLVRHNDNVDELDEYPKFGYSGSVQAILQLALEQRDARQPLHGQLLKWIGNKQRYASEIVSFFPPGFRNYLEPFLGSGAVLATLAPRNGIGSDTFAPLMEIWFALKDKPARVKEWYAERYHRWSLLSPKEGYLTIRESYNASPNGPDLLFLSRSCYGGVVRFRKRDGFMSTPPGPHKPMLPKAFNTRVDEWASRISTCDFVCADYKDAMSWAQPGDLIYCDPPYVHSQAILYGAQHFSYVELLEAIGKCKSKGVYVALSIDGTKDSGRDLCELPRSFGLFERQVMIDCGRSMLKRFRMEGETLEEHEVTDRLLLTY